VSESGITLGAANDEASRGVDVCLHAAANELFRDDRVDDVVEDGPTQFGVGDLLVVLRGDDDGVHRHGAVVLVHHAHLGLAIGAQPGIGAVLAQHGQLVRERVRQLDGHGHELGRFVGGKAEHHALIPGAAGVHPLRDVGGLAVNGAHDGAGLGIEAEVGVGVADSLDRLSHDIGKMHIRRRGDLAGDDGESRGHQRLAGHTRRRVLPQDGIEHGVGDLVGDLVRVPLGDGFRSEEMTIGHGAQRSR